MNIAFCLFNYFPFGGQQRDFLKIAKICQKHGHVIHVFVMDLSGELPAEFKVTQIQARGFSNHRRCLDFSRQVGKLISKQSFDVIVGFNKMPGLDVYYAADTCYREKALTTRSCIYRLSSRYQVYSALERAAFEPAAGTQILVISPNEQNHFMKHYGTPPERFHLLPPGIDRIGLTPEKSSEVRTALRNELNLDENDLLLLMVGSAFKTKGVDRSIHALSALPVQLRLRTRLYIVGQGKQGPFRRLAQRLGVAEHVHFLGGRSDVPRFMAGADLLLHPAYLENTGTVLVEALAAGLPVLASSVCGYSVHIESSGGGLLIPAPFSQVAMNDLLNYMLTSPERSVWRRKALAYADATDLYSLHERAVDVIESVGQGRSRVRTA